MKKNLAARLGVAALAALAMTGVAEAQQRQQAQRAQQGQPENVRCPVPSLTAALTTKLPEGWSQPPITSDLEGTLVSNEGGTMTLVCRYGEAGAISRAMPPRFASCLPAEGGFACTLAREPDDDRFIARGATGVTRGHGFNFDRGREEQDRRMNDVWFAGLSGRQPVLESYNNSAFSVIPRAVDDNLRACREGRYDLQQVIVGRDVRLGQGVCYQTEEGRFGLFTVEDATADNIRLRYRTLR